MANDINVQIIQKIEENDPNYKIIDLKNVENCFEKYFLERILEKLNVNCYLETIDWPSNDTQINIEIVQKIENILNNRIQRIIQKIEKNDPNYKVIDFSNIDNKIDLDRLLDKINSNCYVGNIIWPCNNRPDDEVVQQIENKIKENNWKYERFPSYFVHLLFCRHIYEVNTSEYDKKDEKKVSFNDEYLSKRYNESLKDWKIKKIRESNGNGYLGAIYINDKTNQMVLVQKGTDNFQNFYTDIEGILNGKKVPEQVECLDLVESAIEISKKGTIYNVSITGHSHGVTKVYFFF